MAPLLSSFSPAKRPPLGEARKNPSVSLLVQPFQSFNCWVKTLTSHHPTIPLRLVALRLWAKL